MRCWVQKLSRPQDQEKRVRLLRVRSCIREPGSVGQPEAASGLLSQSRGPGSGSCSEVNDSFSKARNSMLSKMIYETDLQPGDQVRHSRAPELGVGVIVSVDDPAYSVMVQWAGVEPEFMWASCLYKIQPLTKISR
jgi:hypothetical protein